MSVRTTETTVTFRRPFTLAALDDLQPAGTYRLTIDEEEIPGLSFAAFHRTATILHLPAVSVLASKSEAVPVDAAELTAALAADAVQKCPARNAKAPHCEARGHRMLHIIAAPVGLDRHYPLLRPLAGTSMVGRSEEGSGAISRLSFQPIEIVRSRSAG